MEGVLAAKAGAEFIVWNALTAPGLHRSLVVAALHLLRRMLFLGLHGFRLTSLVRFGLVVFLFRFLVWTGGLLFLGLAHVGIGLVWFCGLVVLLRFVPAWLYPVFLGVGGAGLWRA